MRITIPTATLREATTRVKPAVDAKSSVAIFESVLVERSAGSTTITATDMKVRAIHTIPSEHAEPKSELARKLLASRCSREDGTCLVPFKLLTAAVKASDRTGAITISTTPGEEGAPDTVEVAWSVKGVTMSEHATTHLPNDFPASTVAIDRPKVVTFDESARRSFFRAYEAISDDETRYVICGVALDPTGDHPSAIGTDGRQLISANSLTLPFESIVIVPSGPIFAGKLLRDSPWTLEVSDRGSHKGNYKRASEVRADIQAEVDKLRDSKDIGFSVRIATLASRLAKLNRYTSPTGAGLRVTTGPTRYEFPAIDGNYPNWRQVVPDAEGFTATIPLDQRTRENLIAILPSLPLKDMESIDISIDATSATINHEKTAIPLPAPKWLKPETKPFTIRLARAFVLRAARLGFTTFNLISDMDPVVFTAPSASMVAMPMRASKK